MAWRITVQAARKKAGKPQDMFLMVDGLKIARRGYPDTPEAGTWVPIEPGWEVKDVLGGDEIWVKYARSSYFAALFHYGNARSKNLRRDIVPM
jgi:hypothetical protein